MKKHAAARIAERFGRDTRVGIMATARHSKNENVSRLAILKYDMVPVELSDEMQKLNMDIIYNGA